MSCHVDVFLLMELAALVLNPQRGLMLESRECRITKALVATTFGLALRTKNDVRDIFWKKYLTHAHSDAIGSMGDVDSHVRTYAGIFQGSKPLSDALKGYYTYDRWITYQMRAYCTQLPCTYTKTEKVMLHALTLPETIVTSKGATTREYSLTHGILRAILQSSGAYFQCPTCKTFSSVTHTKIIDTITLPRRIAVALDSVGQLCLEDPPLTLNLGEGRVYTLTGVAMRTSGHYRCNVLVAGAWFHYDDGGGNPIPVFVQVTGPSYRPVGSYRRRLLYYVLPIDAPLETPKLDVPPWMPPRGGPAGENAQEEVVD